MADRFLGERERTVDDEGSAPGPDRPAARDDAPRASVGEGSPEGEAGNDGPEVARRGTEEEPSVSTPDDDGREWAENWRANELRALHARVADLERRLRRRTLALTAALASSGVLALAVAVLAAALLRGPEGPSAAAPLAGGVAEVGPSPGSGGPSAAPSGDPEAPEGSPGERQPGGGVIEALQEMNRRINEEIERTERN